MKILQIETNNKNENKKNGPIADLPPSQIPVLAAAIAVALTENKSVCEVRAVLNLVNMIQNIIVGILAQKNICDESVSDFIF